jgi:hypothetical protein
MENTSENKVVEPSDLRHWVGHSAAGPLSDLLARAADSMEELAEQPMLPVEPTPEILEAMQSAAIRAAASDESMYYATYKAIWRTVTGNHTDTEGHPHG